MLFVSVLPVDDTDWPSRSNCRGERAAGDVERAGAERRIVADQGVCHVQGGATRIRVGGGQATCLIR